MNRLDPARLQRFLTAYISKSKLDKKSGKKYEEMHTFLNCNLSKFRNDLPNVAISNSIKKDDIFDIFPDFCVPYVSKTNRARNLKHTPKVAHIIRM